MEARDDVSWRDRQVVLLNHSVGPEPRSNRFTKTYHCPSRQGTGYTKEPCLNLPQPSGSPGMTVLLNFSQRLTAHPQDFSSLPRSWHAFGTQVKPKQRSAEPSPFTIGRPIPLHSLPVKPQTFSPGARTGHHKLPPSHRIEIVFSLVTREERSRLLPLTGMVHKGPILNRYPFP